MPFPIESLQHIRLPVKKIAKLIAGEAIKRYKVFIALCLCSFVLLAVTIAAFVVGSLNATFFTTYKDAFDVSTNLITTVLLTFAAFFSYFRFIHGRTFARKLNVAIRVEVLSLSEEKNLHAIEIEAENVGAVALWDLELTLKARRVEEQHGDWESIEIWETGEEDFDRVIEPEETDTAHATLSIGTRYGAVTYLVVVSSQWGNKWVRSATVANRPSAITSSANDGRCESTT
ncbi:MAG: hypothetical protein AAGG48_29630 [Planctomycetota bacterium]